MQHLERAKVHVYHVNDFGWTEITAEPLVFQPSASEVEKAIERCISHRVLGNPRCF